MTTTSAPRRAINPPVLAAPFGAYSHGVAQSGVLATSGQLAIRPDGTIPEGVVAQSELIFGNLAQILSEAGMDFGNVLRFSAFVTRREDMAAYMSVRDRVVRDLPVKPSSTLMIVSGFTRPEFLVEIEVLAMRVAETGSL